MTFFHDGYWNVRNDGSRNYGHIFRLIPGFAVAFDRTRFTLYLFGARVVNWHSKEN